MTPATYRITEQIRQTADVAAIIGQYVRLRKSGRNYTGQCPFHKDLGPSFSVSPDKGLWHCFGCNLGGDVFAFVQRMENIPFSRARALLAEQYGIALEPPQTREQQEAARSQAVYAQQLGREAAWYWLRVRLAYAARRGRMWDAANRITEALDRYWDALSDDEAMELSAAQARYVRRGRRWQRIIDHLDATRPADLVRRYQRVRTQWSPLYEAQRAAYRRIIEAIEAA